jgi:hypothetical protein
VYDKGGNLDMNLVKYARKTLVIDDYTYRRFAEEYQRGKKGYEVGEPPTMGMTTKQTVHGIKYLEGKHE